MNDAPRFGPLPGGPGPHPFFRQDGAHEGAVYLSEVLRFAAVVVVVAALVYIVVRLLNERRRLPLAALPPRSAALDELDLLYARGAIDRAQFLARRADLVAVVAGGVHTPPPPPPPSTAAAPPPQAAPST